MILIVWSFHTFIRFKRIYTRKNVYEPTQNDAIPFQSHSTSFEAFHLWIPPSEFNLIKNHIELVWRRPSTRCNHLNIEICHALDLSFDRGEKINIRFMRIVAVSFLNARPLYRVQRIQFEIVGRWRRHRRCRPWAYSLHCDWIHSTAHKWISVFADAQKKKIFGRLNNVWICHLRTPLFIWMNRSMTTNTDKATKVYTH